MGGVSEGRVGTEPTQKPARSVGPLNEMDKPVNSPMTIISSSYEYRLWGWGGELHFQRATRDYRYTQYLLTESVRPTYIWCNL